MTLFGGLNGLFKLDSVLAMLDDSTRKYILDQLKQADTEISTQLLVNKQLEADLQADIIRERKDGAETSPLYQKLPPEVRQYIFSHVVDAECSIHVFPPRGNESHGYRLSLCEETAYNWSHGHCQCENGRNIRPSVQSDFFDNAIFLVSRTVRREALDAFFSVNRFTFTCFHEFIRFANAFKQSVSKMQSLRLLEKLDDYPASEHKIRSIQRTRERMRNLKYLDLHLYISTWSAYETLYEDGLINELIHFAFGPPPAEPKSDQKESPNKGNESKDSDAAQASDATKQNDTPVTDSTTVADAATATLRSLTTLNDRVPNNHGFPAAPQAPRFRALPVFIRKRLLPDFGDPEPIPTIVNPIQPLKSFTVSARPRGYRILPSEEEQFAELGGRLEAKLTDIFMNTHRVTVATDGTVKGPKYIRVEDVPRLQAVPPKMKVRDDELPLESKKGILFMKD